MLFDSGDHPFWGTGSEVGTRRQVNTSLCLVTLNSGLQLWNSCTRGPTILMDPRHTWFQHPPDTCNSIAPGAFGLARNLNRSQDRGQRDPNLEGPRLQPPREGNHAERTRVRYNCSDKTARMALQPRRAEQHRDAHPGT